MRVDVTKKKKRLHEFTRRLSETIFALSSPESDERRKGEWRRKDPYTPPSFLINLLYMMFVPNRSTAPVLPVYKLDNGKRERVKKKKTRIAEAK